MRKVVVSMIVSLDGFHAALDGNPVVLPMGEAFNTYNLQRMETAGTMLLGATSWQMFSGYWPFIADAPADPADPRLDETNRAISRRWNELDKVVVSDTLEAPTDHPWSAQTSVVSRTAVADWVLDARDGDGIGDILVFASPTTWNGLLAQGLVDEIHLMVGGLALGEGRPVFTSPVDGLRLLDVRTFEGSDNHVVVYAAR